MTRLIDADVLMQKIETYLPTFSINPSKIVELVENAPIVKRPHAEWIPCSERLPEEQGQYYVSGGNKVWICDFLIFSNFKGGWCNNVSNPVVEAWMPLPEPYKKEGEEE